MLAQPFPLSSDFGTLAGDLGCFPLDHEAYPPRSDSRDAVNGIRSLVEIGTLVRALAHPVLYRRQRPREASPKAISGRTSYFQV